MKTKKERKKLRPFVLLIIIFVSYSYPGDTYCWIRYNQAGYMPHSPKTMIVMSEKNLEGTSWKIFFDSNKHKYPYPACCP
jgi:hypothetical protein